jgi:hypothetical protein
MIVDDPNNSCGRIITACKISSDIKSNESTFLFKSFLYTWEITMSVSIILTISANAKKDPHYPSVDVVCLSFKFPL